MEFIEAVMDELLDYFRRIPYASRLTLSGGDPLDNGGLTEYVIRRFKEAFPEKAVWLYTGYVLRDASLFRFSPILSKCDVVVDGEFEEPLRDITLQFRGSSNQRLIDVHATKRQEYIVLRGEKG